VQAPRTPTRWWEDGDRRRAVLLSLFLHLALLLAAIGVLTAAPKEPPPTYLVIDVGAPAFADVTVDAATADAPAPSTPRPQVVDTRIGAPQAASVPVPVPAAETEAVETAQPEVPAAAPQAPTPTTVATPRPPTPALAPPVAAAAAPLAVQQRPTTALPEITPPEVVPTPMAQRIPVPLPQASTLVAESRAIAPTPQVTIAAAAPVPTPSVSAQVALAVPIPTPSVAAQVSPGAPVPIPAARVDTVSARPVARPDVQASVAVARDVTIAPQLTVVAARNVPLPSVRADVAAATPAPSAPAVDAAAAAADTDLASTRRDDTVAGGDAANPGQAGPPDPAARADAAGMAASPSGVAVPTGSAGRPREAITLDLQRPLSVLIDNAVGVPIAGIAQASAIVEMPVEGGISRLMLVFDRNDPVRVGPVRSARDYFVELARRSNALLVHDGGSPNALEQIARSGQATFNAYSSGSYFARGEGRAPYNLFAATRDLRAAVNRIDPGATRRITGSIYRPLPSDPDAQRIEVGFGGARSVFEYQEGLAQFRWLRSGDATLDADGRAVLVDAVLVAAIEARPVPLDSAGRLVIPLSGGNASMYLFGKRIDGSWTIVEGEGVRFVTDVGESIDLAPYRVWIAFTPSYDQHVATP
jgi:hypothetical protein